MGESVKSDIIINSTSLGLNKNDTINFNLDNVDSSSIFYDVIYKPEETNFLKTAKRKGCKIQNGLMMFIYQAAESFKIWHNIEPTIDKDVINFLKMIRIALIGDIGSGKTFVSKCFNYPCFNADDEVNKIYKNNKTCFYKLKRVFPNNIKNFPILKSEIKQMLSKKKILNFCQRLYTHM